jgi:hypothetical protein
MHDQVPAVQRLQVYLFLWHRPSVIY